MGEGNATGELTETVADVPVTLKVEVARLTLSMKELAGLRSGQVLLSGAQIGNEVVLRAGDRAVAAGELVNVEGELAVRLTRVGG